MLELLRTDETNPKTSFSFHCEQNVCNLLPGDWVILLSRGAVNQFFKNDGKDAQAYLEKSILTGKYQNVTEWLATYRKLDTINTLTNEKVVDRAVIAIEILSQQSRKKIIRLLGFPEDKPVFLQFLSTYEEIDTVTPRILKEMDEAGYNDETIRKMKLTVTELLANAIGHGNQNEPRKKVTVGHVVEPEMTLVGVMDEGDGFDPAIIPDPTLPENLIKDHGRGLYIVGNYIDEMLFNKKGNRILIKKNRLRRT
jgi:serine/threonine-protein kinase RsbW